MKTICILTHTPEETLAVGKVLGQILPAGSVLCLYGDLGAGKTKLTQGIGKGLGIKELINSPTFTLINHYQGRLPLHHLDLYRVETPEELEELGWEDYLYGDGLAVVEWPEKLYGQLPADYLKIILQPIKNPEGEQRKLRIKGVGKAEGELLPLIYTYLASLAGIKISTG